MKATDRRLDFKLPPATRDKTRRCERAMIAIAEEATNKMLLDSLYTTLRELVSERYLEDLDSTYPMSDAFNAVPKFKLTPKGVSFLVRRGWRFRYVVLHPLTGTPMPKLYMSRAKAERALRGIKRRRVINFSSRPVPNYGGAVYRKLVKKEE